MNRLAATTRLDIAIQFRSKLYAIAFAVATLLGIVIRLLVPVDYVAFLMPVFYLSAIGGTAYMFVGGMVIFEKDEGTLDALNVTPLHLNEYLLAKSLSLLMVVLMESLLVLFVGYGFSGYNFVPLVFGIVVYSLGLTLLGFVQVSRFASITDFIVYAIPVIIVLQLPVLDYTGLLPSKLWYAIPSMAPLLLWKSAFFPIETWQWIYALSVSVLSLGIVYLWARHAYVRNIVMRGG